MRVPAKPSCQRRISTAVLLLLGSMLVGCSQKAGVVLHQPFAPPSQQHLELKSRWAFTAARPEGRSCLLEFPVPHGDADDLRDFHIYLTLPGSDGELLVAPDAPGGVRGFLIQEVGLLRGKTELVAGTVRCRRVLLQPRLRRLDLNVQCADGSSITGQAYVGRDQRELRRFEREFANDVADLCPEGAEADETAETTIPRGAPGP